MNKVLFVPLFALAAIGVVQDLTPMEQYFLWLLGEGHDVTLTHGIGITWLAYGEEQTYDTTIETTFPVTDFRCEEYVSESHPYADCLLRGDNFFIGGDGVSYSWDWTVSQYVPTAQLIQEAQAIVSQGLPEYEAPDQTRHEILKEKKNLTEDEQHELNYYEGIDDCMNNVLAFQSGRIFEVERDELGQPIVSKAIDNTKWTIGTHEHRIAMANNECVGQRSIYAMVGERTYNVIDYNPYHADIAESIEPWSQERLTAVQNYGLEKWNENSTWCDYYPSHTRGMFEQCQTDEKYVPTLPTPEQKDYYDNDPMKNFFAWNDDPDSQLKGIMSDMRKKINVERNIGGNGQ